MADNHSNSASDIVNHMLNNDPFSRWMGIEIMEVNKGFCKITCPVKEDMMNGFNITHGGIIFSLADSALAFASATYGRVALAIDNSISFTQKTSVGDILIAEAECINLTHKTGLFEIRVTKSSGQLIALMKGSVYRTHKEFEI